MQPPIGVTLGGRLSTLSWVFQPSAILCWYTRALKTIQGGSGEESLSNILPGQLEPNALFWPPNKESIIIIYHSCLLLIAQYNKIELHKCLYNEWCGWSSLKAGWRFEASCISVQSHDPVMPRAGQNVALGGLGNVTCSVTSAPSVNHWRGLF